jgi:hypothetical protein
VPDQKDRAAGPGRDARQEAQWFVNALVATRRDARDKGQKWIEDEEVRLPFQDEQFERIRIAWETDTGIGECPHRLHAIEVSARRLGARANRVLLVVLRTQDQGRVRLRGSTPVRERSAPAEAGGDVDREKSFPDSGIAVEQDQLAARDVLLPEPADGLGFDCREWFGGEGESRHGVG